MEKNELEVVNQLKNEVKSLKKWMILSFAIVIFSLSVVLLATKAYISNKITETITTAKEQVKTEVIQFAKEEKNNAVQHAKGFLSGLKNKE
jgi:hypothetical protein